VKRRLVAVATAIVVVGASAGAAEARERVLTLYSPKIQSQPYVHDQWNVPLAANGKEAPAEPGFVTGFKEMALVDSKDPNAKVLPIAKMMVHHFLYFAPGRVNDPVGFGCWGGSGWIGGRGEEHPLGRMQVDPHPLFRARYGIENRKADGTAPDWRLTAMVMNHYKRPKSFYIRTRVYYTTEQRTPMMPLTIGDCSELRNGMSYDVPGGGKPGSKFVRKSDWTAPFSGRLVGASNHQHGGALYHTLSSRTCKRRIFKSRVYMGPPNHVYNTIRPILHEPGPIGTGAYGTYQGIPITKGEVLRRVAVHDNDNLHVAAMAFWSGMFVRDDSVKPCGRLPNDITEINRPKRWDRTPNYDLVVPQLAKPRGAFTQWDGSPLEVGDDYFRPGRITAKVGEPVTWRFAGRRPHSVTVANGPRGFSSVYWGQTNGEYTVTPRVKGTYKLTCLVHPTSMAQTLEVR
jgi:hypothetical protein